MFSLDKIQWKSTLTSLKVKNFRDTVGPRHALPDSLLDMFRLFFTTALLEYIVLQTNQYALECMGGEKYTNWSPLTVKELEAYYGFMILMGIVHLPSLCDYWKKDSIFHYSPIADKITRDRFLDIHRYLHFNSKSSLADPGTPGYNKLGKVQPIIDKLSNAFQAVYKPHKDVSVDEAMIPFKGRSTLKQYLPKKPIKRGIKVWGLADAHIRYISVFQVYTGKTGNSVEKGLGSNVVKTLCKPYENTYRHIYFDNYFISANLMIDLAKMGLYGCGTLRRNRKGFPQSLKKISKQGMKERGASKTVQYKNLTVSVWQDKPLLQPTRILQSLKQCTEEKKMDQEC